MKRKFKPYEGIPFPSALRPTTKEITEAYWRMHEDDRFRQVIGYP
jgi:tryptophan synthase beta subunit